MWKEESFTDVTIAGEKRIFQVSKYLVDPGSGDTMLQAHKLVLSACSPYFRHLFSSFPGQHPVVLLKVEDSECYGWRQFDCQEVPEDHISLLLEYMYCGYISVSQGSATFTTSPILLVITKIQQVNSNTVDSLNVSSRRIV